MPTGPNATDTAELLKNVGELQTAFEAKAKEATEALCPHAQASAETGETFCCSCPMPEVPKPMLSEGFDGQPEVLRDVLEPRNVLIARRHKIESSNIASVGYDPATSALEVEFKGNAAIYRYTGVAPHEFAELMNAESVGSYFGKKIKPGHKCEKLEAEEKE